MFNWPTVKILKEDQVKKILLTITLILLGVPSVFANGETFGPAEWTQYRMNPENNPVFHSEN